MKKILIIGAGGHGQVTADILSRMRQKDESLQVQGYLDDDVRLHGKRFLDIPVLGPVSLCRTTPHDAVVVAVGDNRIRRQVVVSLSTENFFSVVHPSAVIGWGVEIGAGSMICAGVVVGTGARIGRHVILNSACSVDHHNEINDFVHMAPGCHTGGQVVMEMGALVGLGACLLPRLRIGAWSVIGSGAVVVRDIPPGVVAYGNPCRVVKNQ